MTGERYNALRTAWGATHKTMGEILGCDPRTSRRWAAGDLKVPRAVVLALSVLNCLHVAGRGDPIETARKALDLEGA